MDEILVGSVKLCDLVHPELSVGWIVAARAPFASLASGWVSRVEGQERRVGGLRLKAREEKPGWVTVRPIAAPRFN